MKRRLRGLAYGAAALLGLVVLAIGGVYGFSTRDFNATYEVAGASLGPWVTASAERIERGRHVATIRGCLDCHGEDGGGREFLNSPALGLLWASNLTRGGIAERYRDEDWDRAVRHGVRSDGRPLFFMPAQEYWSMSDADLGAVVAYFRSVEPVDRTGPRSRPGPLARLLYVTGRMPLVPARLVDHGAARPAAPAEGPTAEYGAYLATGCTGCHGPGFSGGDIPGGDPSWPAARNLTPDVETGIGSWSRDDFATALRTGVRPDGVALSPAMPIAATKHMTDTEIDALYAYLMSLEPKPFGSR